MYVCVWRLLTLCVAWRGYHQASNPHKINSDYRDVCCCPGQPHDCSHPTWSRRCMRRGSKLPTLHFETWLRMYTQCCRLSLCTHVCVCVCVCVRACVGQTYTGVFLSSCSRSKAWLTKCGAIFFPSCTKCRTVTHTRKATIRMSFINCHSSTKPSLV